MNKNFIKTNILSLVLALNTLIYSMESEEREKIDKTIETSENLNLLSKLIYEGLNDAEVIESIILESPEILNQVDNTGSIPLHIAARKSDPKVAELLLKYGVNIDAKNSITGLTPLAVAVISNNLPMIQFLVDNNADVNIQDNDGNTPLHLAAKYKNKEAGKIIIASKRVIPGIKNEYGQLPKDLFEENKNTKITEKKARFKTEVDKPIHQAIKLGDTEMLEALLISGANLNEVGSEGKTPLELSLSLTNPEITQLLLNYMSQQEEDANKKSGKQEA